MPSLSLSQKGMYLVWATLLFQLLFVVTLAVTLKSTEDEVEHERQAREMAAELNHLSNVLNSASVGLMEQVHVFDPPSSENFRRSYSRHLEQIPPVQEKLKRLATGSLESLRQEVRDLNRAIEDGLMLMEQCRQAYYKNSPGKQFYTMELQRMAIQMTEQIDHITERCRSIQQAEMTNGARSRDTLMLSLIVGGVIEVGLAVMLATAFTRGIARRLELVRDNSLRLGIGMPLHPVLEEDDEIGSVDQAFHKMAESLGEAMRRERAMIENAVDLICSIDSGGSFINVNPASLQVLGYEPGELLGRRYLEVVHDEDKDGTIEALEEIAKKRMNGQCENRLVRKDLTSVDTAWSVHWSDDEHALFCVIRDISQQKQVERMKQEFVSMVSHDLRAPLTSIQMALDLVAMGAYGEISESGKESLSNADQSITRLINLVNGLLSLERMESGKVQLAREELDAADVVEPAIHAVQGLASKGFVALVNLSNGAVKIFGDRDRLVQVIVNLLSNAVKFSPEHESVSIAVQETAESVRFEILDRGRGVPDDKRDLIFERFKQVHPSDEKLQGGSGLGLPICKAIVELHGGRIGVQSRDGGGSIFWFTIPSSAHRLVLDQPDG